MTIPSQANRSGPYNGNGVTTVFDYEFRIADKAHLSVIRADTATGAETLLALGTDYTVTGVGDPGGGQVITSIPPSIGQTILNLRNVPFVQEIDLENQGPIFAETIEDALDLSVMRDQQLQEQVDRSVKIPPSMDPSVLDSLLNDIALLADRADEIDAVAAVIAEGIAIIDTKIADALQKIAGIEAGIKRWQSVNSMTRRFYAGNIIGGGGASAVSGGATAVGRTFVNGSVSMGCRQDGFVRTINIYVDTLGAAPTDTLKFKVLRPNGTGSYTVPAESELLTPTQTGKNTFNLTKPLPVQPGDHIGLWIKGAAVDGVSIDAAVTTDTIRYFLGDATGGEAYTDSPNISLPIECLGVPPFVVIIGESIQEGHNDVSNWHSHYHTGPTGNPLAEPMNQVRARIPTLEYQNWAEGSTLWSEQARKATLLADYAAPRAVIVGGGINDIVNGVSWATAEANMNLFKAAVPAGVMIFVLEMLPYTPGTDMQVTTIRTWNANYAAWCAANGAILIPCHDAMGQIRPSTGQLDDLITAYHYSGGHLTYAGVDAFAALIASALKKETWL